MNSGLMLWGIMSQSPSQINEALISDYLFNSIKTLAYRGLSSRFSNSTENKLFFDAFKIIKYP
ncbi:hypothetical protein [Lyngbya sp. PCC 8106]|uniref:hypothetical protein n=1 Tax=Lyngbya sp. (strain PCC 8106) TaxID=313612 RepID=UPI0000EA8CCC|nr:hypothetical protein [Lyngbya sp. PCC 8106]EAW36231.1 hypothetical protein L8106_22916 [Lyngbya sp. PCC 8106]